MCIDFLLTAKNFEHHAIGVLSRRYGDPAGQAQWGNTPALIGVSVPCVIPTDHLCTILCCFTGIHAMLGNLRCGFQESYKTKERVRIKLRFDREDNFVKPAT